MESSDPVEQSAGASSSWGKTLAAYAAWAERYDQDPNTTRDADRAVMLRLAPRFRAKALLELGCGTGKNTQTFAEIAESVLGLDISPAMLAVARAKGLPDSVRLAEIQPEATWPAARDSVDIVTASLVLEHIEELGWVFSEAARVLRSGGWLWISELHPARQRAGSRARFRDAKGQARSPACFLHDFSDYLRAGSSAGFVLRELEEPGEGERPRLLVLGLQLESHRLR